MADPNDTLMREIKEEIERERLAALWKRYNGLIIGAVIALLTGVVGGQIWVNHARTTAEGAGERYDVALTDAAAKKLEPSLATFSALAAEGPEGYAVLAGLQVAATHLEAGRSAEAIAAFEAVAKREKGDKLLTDYAALQAATLRVGAADFTEIENRLKPLLGDDNAWRYGAREVLGLAALGAGRTSEARTSFETLLTDMATPAGLRERAQIVLSEIVAASAPPASPAAEPAKPAGTN
ncbi:MAG: tetratricopeptide repeat protein [Hyphomicrobiaceae bacterium]|nr:tetratricopeptide repeat protein [Hyphomicrobiaceae bacterium]